MKIQIVDKQVFFVRLYDRISLLQRTQRIYKENEQFILQLRDNEIVKKNEISSVESEEIRERFNQILLSLKEQKEKELCLIVSSIYKINS